MTETRSLRVFLCHSSDDKPVVRELYHQLIAEGWIDVWLDEEKLFPGDDWNMKIEEAVEAADAILVCLSNNSITKEGYIQREIRIVLDYADYKPEGTLYLIPVRLENCEPSRRLRRWQYADYFEQDRDSAYQRLLVSLERRAKGLEISTEKPKEKSVARPKAEPKLERVTTTSKPLEPADKYTPDGYAIYTIGGIEFVKISAGNFLMGSNIFDEWVYDYERPLHTVDLSYDYYIGRFPITNQQFADFTTLKGIRHPVRGWENKKDHPVTDISWVDAMVYCDWLNDLLRDVLPEGLGLCLPSEAEWEKAARGADGNVYPWGDTFDKNKCNTVEGNIGDTTPVGSYSLFGGDSPYGCADMAGNVREWTRSLWGKDQVEPQYIYPYQISNQRENKGADQSILRILRGSSFGLNMVNARCFVRYRSSPLFHNGSYGLRVAVSPAFIGQ